MESFLGKSRKKKFEDIHQRRRGAAAKGEARDTWLFRYDNFACNANPFVISPLSYRPLNFKLIIFIFWYYKLTMLSIWHLSWEKLNPTVIATRQSGILLTTFRLSSQFVCLYVCLFVITNEINSWREIRLFSYVMTGHHKWIPIFKNKPSFILSAG